MKKLLSAVFFLTLCCSAANAHPVKVTLSNGQVVYLESDNYPVSYTHLTLPTTERV